MTYSVSTTRAILVSGTVLLFIERTRSVEAHATTNKRMLMNKLSLIDWIALVLVIVGGLNWGLVGVLDFNLVATIFGDMSILSRIVYGLVGLSAIYLAVVSMRLAKK